MAEVKVTKKDMFNEVIALAEQAGRHEIELLAKRNSADSKAKAKKAAENTELANKIVEYLAGVDAPVATLEIATAIGISTQKATPILKGLVDEKRVVETVDKRKKFFALA